MYLDPVVLTEIWLLLFLSAQIDLLTFISLICGKFLAQMFAVVFLPSNFLADLGKLSLILKLCI